ncbi:50S ribosomal protein L4 [Persicitalea sp.]|uniref:50S ribosomal protein L4 n=1 Tax=Persicitalea sp. TaxID=3100273 RepID=UPI003593B7B3
MELSILNVKGEDTGKKVTLSEEIFGIEPNEHVVYLDVKQYLANQRQGTHKAKERGEVNYSTRKLKRQKGTGGARAGSRRSPIMVGGGRIFGPRPRDYGFKINKKTKVLARKSVLAAKAQANAVMIFENFTFDAPKTKDYLQFLDAHSLTGKKTLLILGEADNNVYLSGRNIPKTKITTAAQVNTYELLHADRLLISEPALIVLDNILNRYQ